MGTPSIMAEEQIQGELEVEAFCLTVAGLQRLMAGERVLMVGIIPHAYQKKMFEMITRESLDAVIKDGEAITSRTKKAVANNDFLSIMTVFQVSQSSWYLPVHILLKPFSLLYNICQNLL